MNVHQLYSEEEMDEARQIAEAEKASENVGRELLRISDLDLQD